MVLNACTADGSVDTRRDLVVIGVQGRRHGGIRSLQLRCALSSLYDEVWRSPAGWVELPDFSLDIQL